MSTIQNENNIHIKLQFNDEFRRFNVPRSTKYVELLDKVKVILVLNEQDFTIKYKDDENEWITISSDIELETGVSFAKASLLRLLVCVKGSHPKCSPSEGECGPEKWGERWRKRMEKFHSGEGGDECGPHGRFGPHHGPHHGPHRFGPHHGGPHHGGPHGRKWRRWGDCENDEDSGECKRWKKKKWEKYAKKFDCDDTVSSGECGRARGRGRRWRKNWEENEGPSYEEKKGELEEGEKKCPYEKHEDLHGEEWSEKKKIKREEKMQRKREKINRKGEKHQRKEEEKIVKKDEDVKSSGEEESPSGDELMTLEQIKKEIETLKDTSEKLRAKNEVAQQQLTAIRTSLKEKRSVGAIDELLALKTILKTKKSEKWALSAELKRTIWRIKKLSKLAASKSH